MHPKPQQSKTQTAVRTLRFNVEHGLTMFYIVLRLSLHIFSILEPIRQGIRKTLAIASVTSQKAREFLPEQRHVEGTWVLWEGECRGAGAGQGGELRHVETDHSRETCADVALSRAGSIGRRPLQGGALGPYQDEEMETGGTSSEAGDGRFACRRRPLQGGFLNRPSDWRTTTEGTSSEGGRERFAQLGLRLRVGFQDRRDKLRRQAVPQDALHEQPDGAHVDPRTERLHTTTWPT